jgi:uncharacterized protein (UPF0548 family)
MADWERLNRLPLNYGEQGGSAGELPVGYHHIRRTRVIGTGRDLFEAAAATVMGFGVQRAAGLRLRASASVAQPDTLVTVSLGPLHGSCRVIYTVEEDNRHGFAYGTLQGHPESGEEYFGVCIDPATNTVCAEIIGFSRPALWWSRLGSGLASRIQRRITDRYLSAFANTVSGQ